MATMQMLRNDLIDELSRVETRLRQEGVKRIVMAGADAEMDEMSQQIQTARHVRTGAMLQHVGTGDYHEELGGGSVNVYPQGTDSRGVRNAMKAFVINYGIGGNPTRKGKVNRTGDKFITGIRASRKAREKVGKAMDAEAEAFLSETQGGR